MIVSSNKGTVPLNNPRELYHRCLDITPHELEDEVVMKGEEITTYQQVVALFMYRTTHWKYKALSKAAERSHVHAT